MDINGSSENNWYETKSWADDLVYLVKHLTGPLISLICLVGGGYLIVADLVPERHSAYIYQLIFTGVTGGTALTLQKTRSEAGMTQVSIPEPIKSFDIDVVEPALESKVNQPSPEPTTANASTNTSTTIVEEEEIPILQD